MPELEATAVHKVKLIDEEALEEMFRDSIESRRMPDYFLYLGERGSQRWFELCASEDFPVASNLACLLEDSVLDLSEQFIGPLDLMSMGVGGGAKERLLLENLMPACDITYIAVDISSVMVELAVAAVADIPVPVTAVVARLEDLPRLDVYCENPVLLCMLGNTFCNFDPDFVLSLVRVQLGPGDAFLFDCSLQPNGTSDGAAATFAEQVERAYGSATNRRFNIWPLVERGVDEEACRLHLDLVRVPSSAGDVYRTNKRLEILSDSTVAVAGGEVSLPAGETIQMGCVYKYKAAEVRSLLKSNNFEESALFLSADGESLLALVR